MDFTVSIIGCGFVGLVSASAFASRGINVIATSLKQDEVDKINKHISPFFENGLNELLGSIPVENRLRATTDNNEAIFNSSISFISVGTPPNPKDNSIDLSQIERASADIGHALAKKDDFHLVVDRSTIVPGTTRNIIGETIQKKSGKKMGEGFGLCMQPEFLREGCSVYDIFNPNRIIIGELDKKSGDMLEQFWKSFYGEDYKNIPVKRMSLESAEMVKYASNCLLATKISFANEISRICELYPNMDSEEIMDGVGLDDRINRKFLYPGAGFGGSCFAKDVKALKMYAKERGVEAKMLNTVLEVNEDQAFHVVNLANELVGDLVGKTITLLGLSFKPGTDDMREAPSIRIIHALQSRRVKKIIGYDPEATESARKVFGEKIKYADSIETALSGSNCAILVTEWPEFKNLTPEIFKNLMKSPCLVDTRRIYDFNKFKKELNFKAIGRMV